MECCGCGVGRNLACSGVGEGGNARKLLKNRLGVVVAVLVILSVNVFEQVGNARTY